MWNRTNVKRLQFIRRDFCVVKPLEHRTDTGVIPAPEVIGNCEQLETEHAKVEFVIHERETEGGGSAIEVPPMVLGTVHERGANAGYDNRNTVQSGYGGRNRMGVNPGIAV